MAAVRPLKAAPDAPSSSAPPAPPPLGGYTTLDGNEAIKYVVAGARLVSCVRQHPNNPFKPGKRYTFLETKEQLDQLLARSEGG